MNGTLTTGAGEAAGFVAAVADELAAELGFAPYHGTLNFRAGTHSFGTATTLTGVGDDHCEGVDLSPCRVGGVRAAVIEPLVPDYPAEKDEIVAPVHLRSLFGVGAGDEVAVAGPDDAWPPGDLSARASALSAFEAVVFDLDRTLLTLDVDWEGVFEEVETLLGSVADRPVTEYGQSDLFAVARASGRADRLEEILRSAERSGAERATRLPALDALSELDCPVGVCTANAVSAAERALETVGAREAVDAIVGRRSVVEGKPHPRPLVETFGRLDANPGDGVFVGDRDTDAGAAVGAGASFLHPTQLWPET